MAKLKNYTILSDNHLFVHDNYGPQIMLYSYCSGHVLTELAHSRNDCQFWTGSSTKAIHHKGYAWNYQAQKWSENWQLGVNCC